MAQIVVHILDKSHEFFQISKTPESDHTHPINWAICDKFNDSELVSIVQSKRRMNTDDLSIVNMRKSVKSEKLNLRTGFSLTET